MQLVTCNTPRSLVDLFDDVLSNPYDLLGREVGHSGYPRIDIAEESDHFKIRADLPGLAKEDIAVTVKDGLLTISGEKKKEFEKTEKNRYYHFERSYGKFERSFNLPENIYTTHIDANYKNGVLELTLKKGAEPKPRAIEIRIE